MYMSGIFTPLCVSKRSKIEDHNKKTDRSNRGRDQGKFTCTKCKITRRREVLMNKKPPILFIIFISFFCFIVISSLLRSLFLEQQRELLTIEQKNQDSRDIITDLKNEISQLSLDTRIIEIAGSMLNMGFPDPASIISVKKNQVSSDQVNYSLLNFISPEAIAADK